MIINKILWAVATSLIILSGIYFTIKLKGIQFKFKEIILSLKNSDNDSSVTPFETLAMSLAGRIGVGSLAGTALSIYLGGIGSIFWVWITAFLCAPNAFSESLLGVLYQKKDKNGIHVGGPYYYIRDGLNKKRIANLYAILILITYVFGFLSIQSNTITKSITDVISINPIYIGVIITILTALIIFRGVKGIIKATGKIVPIMSLIYMGVTFLIVILNINKIPFLIFNICKEAFNIKALGFGVLNGFIIGIQRGIFSNEAGIGTGAIASATADTKYPVKQGLLQILGVYFTTLVVCTMTAFVIMLSDYSSLNLIDVNGIEITNYAFSFFIGKWGHITVIISIILFAFSTIIAGYYYGESSLNFLNKEKYITLLKIITLIILLSSSIMSSNFLWNFVDIFVAILGIINIISLICFRKTIIKRVKGVLSKE